MFHKHQDSEKETGMFGTLVVMLPCRFTGGELVVHHPSMAASTLAPHVWDPATMNPYDVKYAAFYGDCEHEVKPVTSGYRLCLTYNLVTRSTSQVPRFAANHSKYQRLEKSLQRFFAETGDDQAQKRQRLTLDGNSARVPRTNNMSRQRDCQLVYMLEHKYTNPGLSFAYLKNKDHLVAQCLAKFCEDSGYVFSVYLCKVKYTYEYDPDDEFGGDDEIFTRTVELQSPWVRFGEKTPVPSQQTTANIQTEIAPAGFFEDVSFEGYENHGYTGNAGSRAEKWYTSAALVVLPLKHELKRTGRAGMNSAVTKWIKMVETGSPHAEPFASTLFSERRQWTTTDPCFLPCLEVVRRVNKTETFKRILQSLSSIAFQGGLVATVEHFGWDQCREMIVEIAQGFQFQSRVNLVCSVLHGCEDPMRIGELMSKVNMKPVLPSSPVQSFYGYPAEDKTKTNPAGNDFGRLLALAFRVSPDMLQSYIDSNDSNVLIKLVAPALAAFVTSSFADSKPDECVQVVQSVITQLQARMPPANSWDLSHIRLHRGSTCCPYCTELQMFLSSRTQQTLRRNMTKATRHHIHTVIDRYCGSRVSHVTDRPSTLVMTKRMPAVDLHLVAQESLRSLRHWTGDSTDSSTAGHGVCSVPRPRALNEIIEIDSD